jgi:acyl carrier protein
MEPNDITRRLLALLIAIAPDIEPASIDPNRDLRDQFDFDSMDTLHFATAISVDFGIDVSERDYPQISGLGKACEFVATKLNSPEHSSPAA